MAQAPGRGAQAGGDTTAALGRAAVSTETLAFLRALKRNNRREWFSRATRRVRGVRPRSR